MFVKSTIYFGNLLDSYLHMYGTFFTFGPVTWVVIILLWINMLGPQSFAPIVQGAVRA